MIGWSGALDAVAAYLQAGMPGKLDELRSRLGDKGPLTRTELPDPQLYTTEERAQLPVRDFPALVATARRARPPRLLETGHAGDHYRRSYQIRLYIWVRSKGASRAARIRNRYALGATELLLEKPSMGTVDGFVERSTIEEVPAEGWRDKSGNSIAATFLEFEVTIDETVEAETLYTPTRGAVEVVPAHPALD